MDEILVLGGGPAGCVSALHLSRLGYPVRLITERRSKDFVEGLSARVVDGLRNAGCARTVDGLTVPVPRSASWNGTSSSANQEQVLSRKNFDGALLADARAGGVVVAEGRVISTHVGEDGCQVRYVDAHGHAQGVAGRYLVEARGRRAPRGREVALRGRQGLALSRKYRGLPTRALGTWLASFPGGWAWFADLDRDICSLQIVVDGAQGAMAQAANVDGFFQNLIGQIPEMIRRLGPDVDPTGPVEVRDATAFLHGAPVGDGVIRVGDAAFGIDPLSGHGIFEAVGAGMAVAPVVNTILARPEGADLARTYYADRARSAFLRHARVGRDFYRSEERWSDHVFWRERRDWPDEVPSHELPSGTVPRIQAISVIEDGFIERREVVITGNQPRGVRFIDGIELVPLIDRIEEISAAPDNGGIAFDWLRSQGILGEASLRMSASQLRDNGIGS
jgi:flavin-dependent dehydrogenase